MGARLSHSCSNRLFVLCLVLPTAFCDSIAGTLQQRTIQYSFEHDKVFEGNDHLAALGWDYEDTGFDSVATLTKKSLSGEGMSAPCIGLVSYVYWLNPKAPWWKQQG